MSTSLDSTTNSLDFYLPLAKICVTVIKNQDELLMTSPKEVLSIPVTSICHSFKWLLRDMHENHQKSSVLRANIAKLQINIISQMQKKYKENFAGTEHIVAVVVDLQMLEKENLREELANMIAKFKNILWELIFYPMLYLTFFQEFQDETEDEELLSLLKLSLEVIDRISKTGNCLKLALEKKFVDALIQTLAKNPQVMELRPDLHDQIISSIAKIFNCRIFTLQEPLNSLIKAIVEKMITSDEFWISLISFQVVNRYLSLLDTKAIEEYFKFFQKVLQKIWNPSTDVFHLPQLLVLMILQSIVRKHKSVVPRVVIDQNFFNLVTNSGTDQQFSSAFNAFNQNPSKSKYHALLTSLKILSENPDQIQQEETKKLYDLIVMSVKSDWTIHHEMIIAILNVIARIAKTN